MVEIEVSDDLIFLEEEMKLGESAGVGGRKEEGIELEEVEIEIGGIGEDGLELGEEGCFLFSHLSKVCILIQCLE